MLFFNGKPAKGQSPAAAASEQDLEAIAERVGKHLAASLAKHLQPKTLEDLTPESEAALQDMAKAMAQKQTTVGGTFVQPGAAVQVATDESKTKKTLDALKQLKHL